jgi:hypothetical protein
MDETKTYWEKSNAPIAGFMRLIVNKKKKEKTMTEKKVLKLRFGKRPQEESAAPEPSFDEKLEQARQNAEPTELPSKKATETPNRSTMIQSAPIKQMEATKSPDIAAEILTIIKAYKGDLSKAWKFIIETFEGEDLATAGYQICLIQTNERLARENALREILENARRGIITIPFDPREDPLFIKIIKTVKGSEPAFIREYKEQVTPKEKQEKFIPAPTPEKIKEDYTTKKEQRLADIHSMIDDEAIEEDGVSQ